jgi:DNA-binding NtrC family response regulator
MDAAIADLGRGRHAPGDRGLRFSVAGLARRNDWSHSVRGALALASSLLQRGRPRDAQDVLADAKEYAVNAGHQSSLMEVAVLAGVAWTDLARLDEAESVLHAALAAARSGGDPTWIASSSLALARCLFWRGKYAEANRLVESTAVGTEPTDAAAIRVSLVAARVAVGLGDLRGAVARTTKAVESAAARGDSALVAEAACTAAFAHLSIGDRPAVDRDVATAVRAARSVRSPLRALRARLLGAEIARRFGCPAIAATLLARVGRLSNAKLPATVRARCALLSDLLSASSPSDVVRRHTAATGLNALALYVASESEPIDAMRGAVDHVVNILALCQTAEDERVVLSEVCSRVRSRLQAVAVGFFATERAALVPLAADGSRIEPGIADRVIAARQPIAPSVGHQAIEGGAPVRYGGETLGALVARWVIGAPPDAMSATSILTMAAAASAPAVAAALAGRARAGAVAMGELLGVSAAMAEVRRSTERAAAAPFAVLVEGESGSGKELVARALHRRSARRDRPFCTLNCAALPDDLVEAELFGHARGAFTGAVAERPGVFEEAHMGTLFLDEIGELSLRAQAKLLRTIQDGELRRVGENTARRVDVRIVSATNRNLRQEVAAGRFRLDLLYRLDVIRIPVPPLRDRREDIAVLVEHFWREAIDRVGSRAALSTATVAALARYDWPGNVRELQNVLAALAVRSPKRGVVPPTALPAAFGVLQRDETWRLSEARRTFEERFVRAALVRTGGHRARAAEELGVTRQGLTKLMARLGISDAEETLHSERFITGSEAGHDV